MHAHTRDAHVWIGDGQSVVHISADEDIVRVLGVAARLDHLAETKVPVISHYNHLHLNGGGGVYVCVIFVSLSLLLC